MQCIQQKVDYDLFFFLSFFVLWVLTTSYWKCRKLLWFETRNVPFFLFFGGRRKNFMGMVSNPNVVKLINYVWWVPLANALHLGLEKCTLTTTPSRHEMIIIQKAMHVRNLVEYYVTLVGKWGTNPLWIGGSPLVSKTFSGRRTLSGNTIHKLLPC